jgi:hypothetical protein
MASPNIEPPLVTVTNPVTYLRRWWEKVMGKEGIDFRFTIHPVTAILITAVVATLGFGVGRFVLPESIEIPFFEFGAAPTAKPSPTSVPVWKETAYSGKLQFSETLGKYFLLTTSSEAITLSVPTNINLEPLVGRRIMAVGMYNKSEKLLEVSDARDLEVLPKTAVPIPTIEPTPTPISIVVTPSPEPTDSVELNQ